MPANDTQQLLPEDLENMETNRKWQSETGYWSQVQVRYDIQKLNQMTGR